MRILYVTGMCAPIEDILTGKTEEEITGTPAIFYPWYKLVKKGHQVDFILLSNFNNKIDIKVDWFKEENIYMNIYDPFTESPIYTRIFRRLKRFLKLLYYTNKAIGENNYDFIYCKSVYEGLAGNIIANLRGVPCGMRSLGTMLYSDFQRYGVFGAIVRNPFQFLTFKIKKDFFLMTDDGTKGDLVYEQFRPKKEIYDFYFWKTGVDFKGIDKVQHNDKIPKHDYMFFAARFDDWKRHDRILNILHNLHCNKNFIHLYFAGSITSNIYYDSVKSLVVKYGLEKYVHFLGSIKQDELRLLAYHAVANPLMYDHSNLGNVFFEMFSSGSVIIGLNDGSLDDYIVDGVTGFIVNNEKEASLVVEKLIKDKGLMSEIRVNAVSCAKQNILSLDERFDMEVDLIEKTVESHRSRGTTHET